MSEKLDVFTVLVCGVLCGFAQTATTPAMPNTTLLSKSSTVETTPRHTTTSPTTTPTTIETRTPPPTTTPTTTTLPTTEITTYIPAGCNETTADIVFLVDSSNSIAPEDFEMQKQFIINITNSFQIGPVNSQISVVTFDSVVHPQFYLDAYGNKQDLIKAIEAIHEYSPGNTMTDQALAFAQSIVFTPEHGDRPDVPNFIVLMTDGESTNKNATMAEADLLTANGNITVFTVGIGSQVNFEELNSLATDPNYNLAVDNFEQLRNFVKIISPVNLCTTTAVTTTTTTAAPCFVQKADMVFMLDASNSVGRNQFEKEKNFVSNVVNRFEVGPDNIQFSVVTFESDPHPQFSLNDYSNKPDVLSAIQQIPFITGNTMTGKAITFVLDNVFQNTTGDRADAENILVILTDGQSTDEDSTRDAAEVLRNTSTKVFTIGIGQYADDNELKLLATDPSHEFKVADFNALDSITNGIGVSKIDCSLTNPPTTSTTTQTSTTLQTTIENCDNRQADVVFLLDSSNSEGIVNFNKQKQFVQNFVRSVLIGPDHVLVSVTTFESQIHPQFSLNQYQNSNDLIQAIGQIPYTPGNTFTGSALAYAYNTSLSTDSGARPYADSLVVVLTDGQSTDPNETIAASAALHNMSVQVIAIGVGERINDADLEGIASSSENVYRVDSFEALDGILNFLGNTTCFPTPTTTVTTTTTEERRSTAPITAPPETPAITKCAKEKLDLMFMLDSSNSQGSANFNQQKIFVKNLVQYYDIGQDLVQVGLITFESDVHNQFNLNTYNTKTDLLDAISRVPFTPGNTFTGDALEYIRSESFSVAAGDRVDADNVLIVMTDGQSTDKNDTDVQAELLHNSSISKVVAIGIGASVDPKELEAIASEHSEVFQVPDFHALNQIETEVKNAACIDMSICEDMVDCGAMGIAICMGFDSYARINCAKYCGYCR